MERAADEPPPFLTEGPALVLAIRERPEDFRVEELPAYRPSGEGEHLYVRFEKTGLGTPEAVRRIAVALGVEPRDAGYAGLKDTHAVTTQWASFAGADPDDLRAPIEGVRVLETGRHGNKLRTGHLEGNRFVLTLVGSPETLEPARGTLAILAARGVPNYFGEQRFGRGGQNIEAARRWLVRGGPAPRQPFYRKLYVSTLQAVLFNAMLGARVREGTMDGRVDGDLMRREGSGGLFVSADASDLARVAAFEISPTGPMFGAKMRDPEGEALAREEACLKEHGLDRARLAAFQRFGAGTRRPYRARLTELAVEPVERGLEVRFTLPSGAYATVVLRELLRRDLA